MVELVPVRRRELPAEDPQLPTTLRHCHGLADKGQRDRAGRAGKRLGKQGTSRMGRSQADRGSREWLKGPQGDPEDHVRGGPLPFTGHSVPPPTWWAQRLGGGPGMSSLVQASFLML